MNKSNLGMRAAKPTATGKQTWQLQIFCLQIVSTESVHVSRTKPVLKANSAMNFLRLTYVDNVGHIMATGTGIWNESNSWIDPVKYFVTVKLNGVASENGQDHHEFHNLGQSEIENFIWCWTQSDLFVTYISSWGKFKVMLPLMSSPYFK